jgi:hypothetical protein
MSAPIDSRGRIAIPVLLVVLIVLALPILISVAGRLLASNADETFLEIPASADETCDGRPREFMRFHHMDLLKEIRDEVLREGVGSEVSRGLERCRECHADRDRFCNACHDAVDLSPDCFDCHYYP